MGQKIVDDELGIGGLVADGDLHGLAVGLDHHAVELQGHGDPLILPHAAVVVGLEVGKLGVFIEGIGL